MKILSPFLLRGNIRPCLGGLLLLALTVETQAATYVWASRNIDPAWTKRGSSGTNWTPNDRTFPDGDDLVIFQGSGEDIRLGADQSADVVLFSTNRTYSIDRTHTSYTLTVNR